ncbi:MAG: phosphatidylglycerol:prolipoprotein diacylglycerol transferase [Bacteroidia bacterium]|jgi:phosphatidylglycerol:prolipoprotein diacylglycerol transferase
MYPTLYDLVKDLFGLEIEFFKLIQSFGMMVALAFTAASMNLTSEFKRKTDLGLISTTTKRIWLGKPSSIFEKLSSGVVGFLIGYKFLGIALEFDLVVLNPQDYILSAQGNLLGGFLGAALSIGSRIWEDRKEANIEPKEIDVIIPPSEHVGTITILAAVFGIGGAKIFHNLENWDDLMADPVGSLLSFSGLSFLGGFICATIAIVYYARKHKIPVLQLTDSALPGLMLAYGIGRVGCQVAGDGDWGIPNDAPKPEWMSFLPDWTWSYNYPNNVLGIDLKADFISKGYESLTGYAWPTPLYETAMALCIFAFLWSMRKRWVLPGQLAAWYLLLSGIERLVIEQVRINNEYNIFGFGITQAEIISSILILLGLIGIFNIKKISPKLASY